MALVFKMTSSSHKENTSGVRIQKVLAQMGVGSRREIEKAIIEKRISVNNKLAEIGQLISNEDTIIFDGKLINLNSDETSTTAPVYCVNFPSHMPNICFIWLKPALWVTSGNSTSPIERTVDSS